MTTRISIFSSILLIGALTMSGCGKQVDVPDMPASEPVAKKVVVPIPAKKEESRYVYRGDQRPDPFVPLNASVSTLSTDEVVMPNIATLSLKGIFATGKQRMAIISGGTVTYVLKDSRLYDNRQRLIRGISGAVNNESVILIAPDKTMRELKLHEKE